MADAEDPGSTAPPIATVDVTKDTLPPDPQMDEDSPPRARLSSQSYRDAVGGKPLVQKYRKKVIKVQPVEQKQKASIAKLFRYATCLDWILIIIGTFAAIAHGAAFPVAMLVFGDITNAFVDHDLSMSLANEDTVIISGIVDPLAFSDNITGGRVSCDAACTYSTFVGTITCESPFLNTTVSPSTSLNASIVFTLQSLLEDLVNSRTQCLDDDEFISEIDQLVYIFLGIAGGAFVVGYIHVLMFQLAAERQIHRIRLKYYRSILRQDIGWFDVNSSGELSSRLSDDLGKVHAGIGDNLSILIQWVSTFVAAIVVGFVREWRLALVLLGITPLLALAVGILVKVGAAFASLEQKQYASAGAVAEEVLSSIRTVMAFGGEHKEGQRYDQHLTAAKKIGTKKGVATGLSIALVFFMLFVTYSVSFWFGGYLVSERKAQTGDVLTVFFAILVGAFFLGQAGPNLQNLVTAAGAAVGLCETIDRQPTIDALSDEGLVPEELVPTLDFKDVCFNYPTRPDAPVLKGITFKVDVGQTIALVGPSGCGKSTTIQLLQRFYDLDSGEILVGGNSVKDLNLKWLRNSIGVVSQEPVLFDTTIAENIRYGKEDITMEEIEEAARNASAHEFISKLPFGYNTLVGEGGAQLSGGQKQRIAIARALVRDPKILLLDEATSALDSQSEAAIQNALDRAQKGRTTIVIAHRLSTIQNADVIVAIDNGVVAEVGTHTELMAKKGFYFDLVTSQSYTDLLPADLSPHLPRRRTMTGSLRGISSRSTRRSRVSSGTRKGFVKSMRQSISIFSAGSSPTLTSRSIRHTIMKSRSDSSPKQFRSRLARSRPEGGTSENELVTRFQSYADAANEPEPVECDEEEKVADVSQLRIMQINAKWTWLVVLGSVGAIAVGSVFSIFAIVFGEVLEVFSRPVDEILDGVHLWAGMFLVLGTVAAIGLLVKNVCFSVYGDDLTKQIRSRTFQAMLRQEIGWFDNEKNSTGALTTTLASDAGLVHGAAGIRLATLLEALTGFVLAVIIGLVYSWILALVLLGLLPVIVVTTAIHTQVAIGFGHQDQSVLHEASEIAVDSFENIETVTSFGLQERFYRRFKTETDKPYKTALLITLLQALTYSFSQSMIFFAYIVAFRFGAFLVTLDEGHILYAEFEDVYRVFAAIIFGSIAIGASAAFAPDYVKAKQAAKEVFALMDREPLIDGSSEHGNKPSNVTGLIAVHDVNFKYPARPNVLVLQGLNLSVSPGNTLALVGPSGCGKSTVVSLIERFYDPTGGCLTIDGISLRDLNIRWLRSQIGIVSQEPVLFDTSIAENIRYGANYRQVSDDEVIEAAKAANIHGFIETLPQGYNTPVGEGGAQLSGGQKQRIAIARALVRDPKILLLDEATSALDTESEKIVQEALDKAREGRTSIVIAHRLSTIYNADCIAVLRQGKVIEMGTHGELMRKKGLYYKLNRFQLMKSTPLEESVVDLDVITEPEVPSTDPEEPVPSTKL